ncbi:MAG: acetyl-CoA carboxylase biotin carboxyl carrier protein [Candidatus Aureabacteria bacterium]|nr:acetyl-CoA carboxylase biotin carboxyl carrier protein [Candidatus Auribacterota bacterium]
MNLKEIQEIVKLMKENEITEFEMERDGLKIVLKKSGAVQIHPNTARAESSDVHMLPQNQSAPKAEPSASQAESMKKGNIITSPMVGTFYRAPSPEAPSFVEKGQSVKKGEIVCIIEAMKVMNEIESEFSGKITEIFIENGEPVEFGQPIFRIE